MTVAAATAPLTFTWLEGAAAARYGAGDGRWRGRHLAHAPQWATVVQDAYGHAARYLAAEVEGACVGILPVIHVRRPVGGAILASMPFLDGGGPCAASPAVARALVDELVRHAQRERIGAIDMRCTHPIDGPWAAQRHKANMVLPLPAGADDLWRRLDKDIRNQVRKAERAGLVVEQQSVHALDEFYHAYVSRMRELGSPAHGRRFFEAVAAAFGGDARIVIVRKGPRAVGGLIAISFNGVVTVPWASCLREYFPLCPNMLMYWEAIRAASAGGARVFDFGRSTIDSGTYRFKRQWGALEQPLFWYHISSARGAAADAAGPDGAMARHAATAWRWLPSLVSRRLGPVVRKYLVQ